MNTKPTSLTKCSYCNHPLPTLNATAPILLREVVGRLRELARQQPRDAKQGMVALLRQLEEP